MADAMVADYSFSRPDPRALRAAGYIGVVRYLTGYGKALTVGESLALHAAGLTIAVVYESGEDNALGGAHQGDLDGARANDAANSLGVPIDRPIYYAFDRDDRGFPGCLPVIRAYVDAAQRHGREARVYGSIRVVDYIRKPGWQTAAWSGSAVSAHAALYQHRFQVDFHGSAIDENRALVTDFGQWPSPIPPPPVIVPVPVPAPSSRPITWQGDPAMQTDLSMQLGANGDGYNDLAGVDSANVHTVCTVGLPDPQHAGWSVPCPRVGVVAHSKPARIRVEGGKPGQLVTIRAIHD